MKITHIIGIIIIAIAVGIIVTSAGDASQYADFQTAKALAKAGDSDEIHVVGDLPKNIHGAVTGVVYDPLKDPNYLAFDLKDEKGEIVRVVCNKPPASMRDFEKSEKVVVIGKYKNGQFVASEILMKCPSKYEEKQVKATSSQEDKM